MMKVIDPIQSTNGTAFKTILTSI